MKRMVIVLLALVAIAAVAYFGGQNLVVRQKAEPTPVVLDTGAGLLQAVTIHGRVVPVRWMDLAFGTGGRVGEISVNVGDVVSKGQVLARLEMCDSSLDVQIAEDDVAIQKARLAQALATPEPEGIASARAELASAEAALARLRSEPNAHDVEVARLGLEAAKDNLWAAQASRDAVAASLKGGGGADLDGANARVAAAEVAVRLAELQYEAAQKGPTEDELRTAEARLAQAQENLARLLRPPAPEDLEVLRAGVRQAEARLKQVEQRQLEHEADAQIVAPFAGTITSVEVLPGEFAGAHEPILTLADLTEFRIETTDVDEWALRRVKVGEMVEAHVMALEGRVLPVRVESISPKAVTLPTGETGYMVTLSLDKQDPKLRWGMTVRIEFKAKGPQVRE